MTLQEIIKGESKNIEFKIELPKKSEKYIKSVIAFANTSGGKIILGIDDETRAIVGVDEKSVFQIMDTIANAVSDSCTPQIMPDITFETIENKCIVIIEIYPGANRPYYLKSLGKENGTYIRVGGTSRPADSIKIKELEIEGANLSWDELTCVGYPVKEDAIFKLCSDIKRYMLKSGINPDSDNSQDIMLEQLLNWKVLKKIEGEILASNAFVLLTSEYFPFAKIQCALFKGVDRDIFIDKKEYSGPLYEQIESAYQFILRHINLSAEIEGLVRKESYELPVGAIREMIVNAVCHRNYMDNSCVQVALYDDRVEVTSPGMLYGGLTLEEAMSGRSKIRNRAIAGVFSRMEIVEEWGTGIRRIIKRAEEYGLPKPEFLEIGDTFRVNLFKAGSSLKSSPKTSPKASPKTSSETSSETSLNIDSETNLSELQMTILKIMQDNPHITRQEIALKTQRSLATIKHHISELRKMELVQYIGSSKKGQWTVNFKK